MLALRANIFALLKKTSRGIPREVFWSESEYIRSQSEYIRSLERTFFQAIPPYITLPSECSVSQQIYTLNEPIYWLILHILQLIYLVIERIYLFKELIYYQNSNNNLPPTLIIKKDFVFRANIFALKTEYIWQQSEYICSKSEYIRSKTFAQRANIFACHSEYFC